MRWVRWSKGVGAYVVAEGSGVMSDGNSCVCLLVLIRTRRRSLLPINRFGLINRYKPIHRPTFILHPGPGNSLTETHTKQNTLATLLTNPEKCVK